MRPRRNAQGTSLVQGLGRLKELSELHIADTGTGDAAVRFIAQNHPHLISLSVGRFTTDAAIAHILTMREIRELGFHDCKVTEAGIVAFARWKISSY